LEATRLAVVPKLFRNTLPRQHPKSPISCSSAQEYRKRSVVGAIFFRFVSYEKERKVDPFSKKVANKISNLKHSPVIISKYKNIV